MSTAVVSESDLSVYDRILDDALIVRFEAGDDSHECDIRRRKKTGKDAGFMEIK